MYRQNTIIFNDNKKIINLPSLMEDELGILDTPTGGIFDGGRKPDVFISLFLEFSLILNIVNDNSG